MVRSVSHGSPCLRAALMLAACVAMPVNAQSIPGLPAGLADATRPVQDPGQRLLQNQRDQQRSNELDQAPAQIAAPPSSAAPNLPAGADVESLSDVVPLFRIDHIEFTGDQVLSQRQLDAVTKPFLGKELGRNRINLLLRRLTEAFIEHGFITTRAYLGAQNLASGTLTIKIVAGRVVAFTLNGKPLRPTDPAAKAFDTHGGGFVTDNGTAWAFGDTPGDVLRLPDLEQGVDQINRLRRNQAEIQILPGEAPGDSVVAVTNHAGDRLYYTLGVDNYGSSQTGTTRYRAGIEADNVIGLQESMLLNYVGSENSNALVLSAAVPFGYQTFSYTTSLSEYQQAIGDSALLDGRSFSQILGWNDVLTRSASGRLNVDVTLTKMRTERSVNGISLSPEDLTVLRAGINGLRRFNVGGQPAAATWDVGVSEGLPWLSASHDAPDIGDTEAHSQFTMVDASGTLQCALGRLGPTSWRYQASLRAQYSPVALFNNDQIFLGGMDTVRGFTEGGVSGDRGFYVRNEVVWDNAPAWRDAHIEPYVFLDGGKAHLVSQPGWPSLVGTGAGVRAAWKFRTQAISTEVLVGRALLQPASLGSKGTVLLATLNWSE